MIEIYFKVIEFMKGNFDYLTIITINFISFRSKIYLFSIENSISQQIIIKKYWKSNEELSALFIGITT